MLWWCVYVQHSIWGLFGYGSGSGDTGMNVELQLIKHLKRFRSRIRPNSPEVFFHLRYHRFWQPCSLGKLSQVDNGITLHRCKLGTNSAGNTVSCEYVSLHQNKAEMSVHSQETCKSHHHPSRSEVVMYVSRSNIFLMFLLNPAISDLTWHSTTKVMYLVNKGCMS